MTLATKMSPEQVVQAYKDGLAGWIWNEKVEEEWKEFCSSYPSSLYQINPELKDLHKDRPRALLYLAREKYDPGVHGHEAQTTGDCTSHGSRGARDCSRAVEIMNGDAEIWYKRTATEPTYGARGHAGQGMDPARAAKFETEYGFLFRENYRDSTLGVNLDLSKYNSNIGDNWGRSGVPENIKQLCKQYQIGQWYQPKNRSEVLDLLAAGKAGHSGQSWGTSSNQRADGINRKSGSWSHDMATEGYDFTREFFKEDVFFVPNTWGGWNEPNPVWLAHQDVYGPWCPGMIVIPADEYEDYFINSGSIHFYSDVKGFPVRDLPYIDIDVL